MNIEGSNGTPESQQQFASLTSKGSTESLGRYSLLSDPNMQKSQVINEIEGLQKKVFGGEEESLSDDIRNLNLKVIKQVSDSPNKNVFYRGLGDDKPGVIKSPSQLKLADLTKKINLLIQSRKEIKKEPLKFHLHKEKTRTARKKHIDSEIRELRNEKSELTKLSSKRETIIQELNELWQKRTELEEKKNSIFGLKRKHNFESVEYKKYGVEENSIREEIKNLKDRENKLNADLLDYEKEIYSLLSPKIDTKGSLISSMKSIRGGAIREGFVEEMLKNPAFELDKTTKVLGLEISDVTYKDLPRMNDFRVNNRIVVKATEYENDDKINEAIINTLRKCNVEDENIPKLIRFLAQSSAPELLTIVPAALPDLVQKGIKAGELFPGGRGEIHLNIVISEEKVIAVEFQVKFSVKNSMDPSVSLGKAFGVMRIEFYKEPATLEIDYDRGDVLLLACSVEKTD